MYRTLAEVAALAMIIAGIAMVAWPLLLSLAGAIFLAASVITEGRNKK